MHICAHYHTLASHLKEKNEKQDQEQWKIIKGGRLETKMDEELASTINRPQSLMVPDWACQLRLSTNATASVAHPLGLINC